MHLPCWWIIGWWIVGLKDEHLFSLEQQLYRIQGDSSKRWTTIHSFCLGAVMFFYFVMMGLSSRVLCCVCCWWIDEQPQTRPISRTEQVSIWKLPLQSKHNGMFWTTIVARQLVGMRPSFLEIIFLMHTCASLQRSCTQIKPRAHTVAQASRGMLRYATNEHSIGTQDVDFDCNDVYETKLFYSYVRKKCTRKDLVDAGPGDQIQHTGAEHILCYK